MKALCLAVGIIIGIAGGTGILARHKSPGSAQAATAPATREISRQEDALLPLPALSPNVWAQLESTNYAQYAANLRGVGCPEGTVADIISADLRQALGFSKLQAATPSQVVSFERQNQEALSGLGLHLDRPGDYFFTAEQLRGITGVMRKYPVFPRDPSRDAENAVRRKVALQEVISFTPEQAIYFKSEFERFGGTIDTTLAGFRPTQTEYYAMVSAMPTNSPKALQDVLRSLLSPQRLAEWQKLQTPEHLTVFTFTKAYPGTQEKAEQIEEVLKQQPQLSLQEYRNQLRKLLGRDMFDLFWMMHPYQTNETENTR